MGSLAGSTVTSAAAVNLASPVQTDWIQFATNLTPNRKSGGGSTISAPTTIGSGVAISGYSPDARSITWTGGTPVASATSGDGIFVPASGSANVGDGLQFTLPADPTQRTVVVAWGMYAGDTGANIAAAKLVATLSDGSAASVTHTPTGVAAGVSADYLTTITYSANSAGQTLNIALSLTTVNAGAGNYCNITLQAAKYVVAATGATFTAPLAETESLSAALSTSVKGSASLAESSSVAAVLSTSVRLAASLVESAGVGSALATGIRLSCVLAESGLTAASPITSARLSANLAESASVSADLTSASTALSSVLAETGVTSAGLSTSIRLAATLTDAGVLNASFASSFAAPVSASGSLHASLATSVRLACAANDLGVLQPGLQIVALIAASLFEGGALVCSAATAVMLSAALLESGALAQSFATTLAAALIEQSGVSAKLGVSTTQLAAALSEVGVMLASSTAPPHPNAVTFTVEAAARIFTVTAEARISPAPTEQRIASVTSDTRIFPLPFELRTFKVAA
jgi:hypothetical protein